MGHQACRSYMGSRVKLMPSWLPRKYFTNWPPHSSPSEKENLKKGNTIAEGDQGGEGEDKGKGADKHCCKPAFQQECCPTRSSAVFAKLSKVFENDVADDMDKTIKSIEKAVFLGMNSFSWKVLQS